MLLHCEETDERKHAEANARPVVRCIGHKERRGLRNATEYRHPWRTHHNPQARFSCVIWREGQLIEKTYWLTNYTPTCTAVESIGRWPWCRIITRRASGHAWGLPRRLRVVTKGPGNMAAERKGTELKLKWKSRKTFQASHTVHKCAERLSQDRKDCLSSETRYSSI